MIYNTAHLAMISGRTRVIVGTQDALVVKNLPANEGDTRDSEFNHWVRKIPWRRAWQPTPIFLLGEYHRLWSLVGWSPRVGPDLVTEQL